MNRFEQFKQKFADMTLEDLADYISIHLGIDKCDCCTFSCSSSYHRELCKEGVVSYLKEEVNAE